MRQSIYILRWGTGGIVGKNELSERNREPIGWSHSTGSKSDRRHFRKARKDHVQNNNLLTACICYRRLLVIMSAKETILKPFVTLPYIKSLTFGLHDSRILLYLGRPCVADQSNRPWFTGAQSGRMKADSQNMRAKI